MIIRFCFSLCVVMLAVRFLILVLCLVLWMFRLDNLRLDSGIFCIMILFFFGRVVGVLFCLLDCNGLVDWCVFWGCVGVCEVFECLLVVLSCWCVIVDMCLNRLLGILGLIIVLFFWKWWWLVYVWLFLVFDLWLYLLIVLVVVCWLGCVIMRSCCCCVRCGYVGGCWCIWGWGLVLVLFVDVVVCDGEG